MRQAVGLAVNLHHGIWAFGEVAFVLRGLFGHVFEQALGEHLRHFGVADLCKIRSIAGLDVGFQLLDHILCGTIELGGLDLNVRMILVPLGNNVFDQSHAFGIRKTMHVGEVDDLSGIPAGAGSVGTASCKTHAQGRERSCANHQTLSVGSHISLLREIIPAPPCTG